MRGSDFDTKTRIFNAAIRLFATNGYENVSIRDIAKTVGLKTASIYYHYRNKEKILEACYTFFIAHRHETRLNKEQYEPIIRNGTKKEISKALNYTFSDSTIENMILSLLIIFSRLYTDPKARDVYVDDINCSMQYLTEFFNFGIEIGRFRPFNVPAVSLALLSSRLFTAQSSTIRPEEKGAWHKAEVEIFDELLHTLYKD